MVRMLCYAKLNLTLDVVAKRPDGYHELDSIFHTVSIYDRLTLSRDHVSDSITVTCNKPIQGENIVTAAARIFFKITGIEPCGLKVNIEKNIPIQAGMGGGSADAAGMLHGLCALFHVELKPSLMHKAALYLGADVPFLLHGGTAIASGIGEQLYPVDCKQTLHFLVVKPNEGLSTREIFSRVDVNNLSSWPDTHSFVAALQEGRTRDLGASAGNSLEPIAADLLPVIRQIKTDLTNMDAIYASMTGTGSAVFGVFDSKLAALRAYEKLVGKYDYVEYAFSVPNGVEVFR
ncbi:MAG: 4-(cytidine 5'-diphospho)-2-C-methyl-D-erythritol kinase [Clostridiales bacterium]|nr:4-(cytidine 5'-diphospho)-2-C-methyl-D-erythritol kinase [Clostridiales bacterium]